MKTMKSLVLLVLVLLSCRVAADINLDLSPASVDLGSVEVGSTGTGNATIGIIFNGSGSLTGQANNGSVTSVTILNDSNGFFSASPACLGYAFSAATPADTCIVDLQCAPSAPGVSATAQLEVQFERNNGSAADVGVVALSCASTAASAAAREVPTLGGLGIVLLGLLLAAVGFNGLSRVKP
jgi:hypothetical protein